MFGAVAAYVLIAFTFACLFGLLQYVQPHAFHIAEVNNPDGSMSWSDVMYFSFTVLTSTGFGEITPVTDMARSLIVIEQVLGVMYVAFLVARLANLYGRARAALASAMPDALLPRDGLVIVAKRDCPTCVLVEPVMQSLDRAGPLTVLSQDDPTFPSGVRSVRRRRRASSARSSSRSRPCRP